MARTHVWLSALLVAAVWVGGVARAQAAGVDFGRAITTSCGSGVTAAILALGLAVAGFDDAAVYDGSWCEWGSENGPPVLTG